jgi:hypothetical protein
MGCYTDTCVRVEGQWRLREKIIDPWTSERVAALDGLPG